jgi:hypothetical protein
VERELQNRDVGCEPSQDHDRGRVSAVLDDPVANETSAKRTKTRFERNNPLSRRLGSTSRVKDRNERREDPISKFDRQLE